MLGYVLSFLLGFFVAAELFSPNIRTRTKIFIQGVSTAIKEASKKKVIPKQSDKPTQTT